MVVEQGIRLKKKHGQNFLRDGRITEHMLMSVTLNQTSSIFEIGCGDGFLTRTILSHPCARLWVFEIDPEWAQYVRKSIADSRLEIFIKDFLTIERVDFEQQSPWTVLANLPYHITFPILDKFVIMRDLISEGVIMVQEEVAQKITKTHGRGYGFISLYFQHYFEWKLLDKVPPTAFVPPPKVFSRLLYFKPRKNVIHIPSEEQFWEFIKVCFKQPRRTLKNNLAQAKYATKNLSEQLLALRAQQLDMTGLLEIWKKVSE